MKTETNQAETLNRNNAAPGVAVIFRGKRRIVEEVSGPGVYLKAAGRGRQDKRAYLYFYEAAQFNVVLAEGAE